MLMVMFDTPPSDPDLLIVGAGPAGIAAALEAVAGGLSVLLLDDNPAPGGRIWQGLEARGAKDADEEAALALIGRLRGSAVDARWGASVWAVEPDRRVFFSQLGTACSVLPRTILLATGATERPMPIAGWTLPGVMTVGAAQIALKTGGLLPDGDTWLAGQGPLLLLYASQVLDAGGRIAGVIDLSTRSAWRRAVRHVRVAALPDIRKGVGWQRRLRAAGVRRIRASGLRADGETILRSISFLTRDGWVAQPAGMLLLHDGVIPSVQMTRAMGCAHAFCETQGAWHPEVDDWGMTSVPGVLAAGDATGIGGVDAAMLSGRIAVLGLLGRTAEGRLLQGRRARRLAIRPLLDALYAPLALRVDDATLVCRCEEVTAGAVRQAVAAGCRGMNQLKAYTRCGMGPCQGRMCSPVAAGVLAEAMGCPVASVEPLRTRFPTKPVSVGELTGLLA